VDDAQLSPADRSLVAGTFLFRGAPEALTARALADSRCRLETARRGTAIYTPHDFDRCLGILLSGAVEVTKGELLVSVLAPGDLFGAAALFNDREDYATTLTARGACRLLLFPQELIEELLSRHPALARNYIRYLSGRIRFLDRKLEGLLAGSAERKLAQHLLAGGGDGSATALARRLGVSRASLYRAFDALTAAGAIRRTGRHIDILDRDKLISIP